MKWEILYTDEYFMHLILNDVVFFCAVDVRIEGRIKDFINR
jgi:hypothetical protein